MRKIDIRNLWSIAGVMYFIATTVGLLLGKDNIITGILAVISYFFSFAVFLYSIAKYIVEKVGE